MRTRSLLLTLACTLLILAATPVALAGPFSYAGPAQNNVDTNPATIVTITVPPIPDVVLDLNLYVSISTPYADDIDIFLAHLGTVVQVYNGIGDTGGAYINATFDDEAVGNYPVNGTANGTFIPFQALSAFDGMPLSGTWELRLLDTIFTNDGTDLLAWNISGTAVPEPSTTLLTLLGIGLLAAARGRLKLR